MPSETSWHDLLDAAVPEPEISTGVLDRVAAAATVARRRRRLLLAAGPVVVAVLTASGISLAIGTSSGNSHRAGSPLPPSSNDVVDGLTGAVAYKCGNLICLMNPDGSGGRTLDATFPEWDPAWSPNGQQLAFRGYATMKEGSYAIYVVDADGCHPTRLPRTDAGVTPSWSPDGTQIAFGDGHISVINADGGGLHAITDGGITAHDRWTDSQPAWSPRGPIAFVRAGRASTTGDIYTVDPDGGHVTAITSGNDGYAQPAWSPSGTQLAFVETTGGRTQIDIPMQIAVANADGSDQHTVSPPTWSSFAPTWTPDGRVVFLVKTDTGYSAYIVNADGSNLRKLYNNLGGAAGSWQITWGPAALASARCDSGK